jgi:hypothetical protein
MKTIDVNSRGLVVEAIVDWLQESGTFDAPFGILTGLSEDKRYRSITFGRARVLDAEIRVYAPTFITLRYRTAIRTIPHADQLKFRSLQELYTWMDENFK